MIVFQIEDRRVARKVTLLSLVAAAQPKLWGQVRRHGHRYLELIRWKGADRLECRLRAHDAGAPIDARLDVGLDGTVSSVTAR